MSSLGDVRHILERLMDCFRALPVEQLSPAIDLVREHLESMRAVVKEKVRNDAFGSVTLMAEGMIRETYYDLLECDSPTSCAALSKTPMLSPLYPPSFSMQSNECDLSSVDPTTFSSAVVAVEDRSEPENLVFDLLGSRPTSVTSQSQSQSTNQQQTHLLLSLAADASTSSDDAMAASAAERPLSSLAVNRQEEQTSAPAPNRAPKSTFVCEYCGFASRHRQNLYRHRKLHSRTGVERRFACSFCPKRFKTASALQEHNSYVHSKVRRFACPLCGQSFVEQKDVNRHIKVHEHRLL